MMRDMARIALTVLVAAPASAGTLAFDFDTDEDPTTIESSISADVGELVEAYLVVEGIPEGYDYVHGLQFGLDLTAGLELAAIEVVGLVGAMAQDGSLGLAVLPEEPVAAADFPSFVMRFVFEVLDGGPQSASIIPSRGWGQEAGGFIYLVSEGVDGAVVQVEDVDALATQRSANVNAPPLPVVNVSWGEMKAHF